MKSELQEAGHNDANAKELAMSLIFRYCLQLMINSSLSYQFFIRLYQARVTVNKANNCV